MDPVVEHERNELLMRIRMPDGYDGYSKSVDLRDVNSQINQLTPSDFEKLVSYMYGTREIDQDVAKNLYCLSTYANVSLRRALKDIVESVKNIVKDQAKLEHYPMLQSFGAAVFDGCTTLGMFQMLVMLSLAFCSAIRLLRWPSARCKSQTSPMDLKVWSPNPGTF